MAFERPCLVFADLDGNMYDEPDLHMLSLDASAMGLPRPEEVTPLPAQCELVLLPGRYALGLEPETGEVVIHEGFAVAALVPSNYLAVGLPAAHSDSLPPALPHQAYAAVGFANNRFYMAAKKIDEAPKAPPKVASKKTRKAGNALRAHYPENRLIRHLVTFCLQENNCWAAQNLCLGTGEIFLPISPLCPCKAEGNSPSPSSHSQAFSPNPQEILEVMLHHARSAVNPVISFGHPCNISNQTEFSQSLIDAIRLFRKQDTSTPLCLHLYDSIILQEEMPPPTNEYDQSGSDVSHGDDPRQVPLPYPLPLLAQAGLSDISFTISCLHSRRGAATDNDTLPTDMDKGLHAIFETSFSLALRRTINYEYFPGLSDTVAEADRLVALLKDYSIHFLRLTNYPCDPHRVVEDCEGVNFGNTLGPVMGIGNFLKYIKRECPHCKIVSATSLWPKVGKIG